MANLPVATPNELADYLVNTFWEEVDFYSTGLNTSELLGSVQFYDL
ncbi:hypothetical protein [Pseudoprimorskyibacter insulae]|uniref:Uncharacterized protein n=1 Tax=Pseudoprimorskyibacter insulae TaxID=1695997 RepID=A0A2R8ARL3_9RHOB|nr:hypothetical protein [Pseudoprimorskyibacter insulae]SPF78504.1 hypothetical protein PRI8871_01108 [Pseudoprimorskyibacter insulae]